MNSDPRAVALAACFVTGCLLIDALRERAQDVRLVLMLVLIVLANLAGGLLLSALAPAIDAVPVLEPIALGPEAVPEPARNSGPISSPMSE